jgi:hypothetical protein
MSTQLIIYPQNYNGQYNFISNPIVGGTNFITGGSNFAGIGSTSLYSTNAIKPALAAIVNEHPYIVNTWYRFTTVIGPPGNWGAVAAPSLAINNLQLSIGSGDVGHTGVYQQLSGLTVGAWYDVKILIVTGQIGTIQFSTYELNTGVEGAASTQFSTNTTSINWSFLATSTNPILLLDYVGEAQVILISNIEVLSITSAPSGIFTDLQDGQVICDLYQEEDIPLTLSIDDFKNVAEKVQSYSKAFNLPATKRNNRIFNNMFEVTRSDDGIIFNPYVKTKCVLKQDGFILFEGYLRLIDVKDKEGEISYSVNLYSEVVALADTLKESTFSNLDFSELDHAYTYPEIRNSWQGILGLTHPLPLGTFAGTAGATTTAVLKYPFIDWTGQIGISGGNPVLDSLEQAFRPCIQLKYLINRIFESSGFTYTSAFFDTADFEKLFMDFNWGAENNPVQAIEDGGNTFYCNGGQGTHYAGTSYTNFVLDNTGLSFFFFPPNYNDVTNIITATSDNESYDIDYTYAIKNTDTVTRTFEARYLKNNIPFEYTGVQTLNAGETFYYAGNVNFNLYIGDTIQAQFKASSAGVIQQVQWGAATASFGTNVIIILGVYYYVSQTILQTLRGELGQWDFLKGIMTMFNLVSMVDVTNPNNILIEPYLDIFINNPNSVQHDWTDKVDASQMDLTPLTELNKNTIFQFVEDEDDHVFNQYKNSTSGHLYGSKEIDASGFTILQGTKEIVAEPFAATVSRPLFPSTTDLIVPAIFAKDDSGVTEGFENSPRIFYNNYVPFSPNPSLTSCTYSVPAQNGELGDATEDEYLQFSHLSSIAPAGVASSGSDFVFESNQLYSPIGGAPIDNLYNTYWSPYFRELYSPDTRIMKLKVNLNPSDVARFNFFDTVFIKNRSFRVNKIEYKPNTLAKVEFILIP